MKKLISPLVIVITVAQLCFGQNSYPPTGAAILNSGGDRSLIIKDGRSGTNWNYIEWQFDNGSRDWVLGRRISTGYFTLWRDGVNEVLTVDNAGKVGIGTTSPSEKLTINGTGSIGAEIATDGTSSSRPVLSFKRGAGFWNIGMNMDVGNTDNFHFRYNGTSYPFTIQASSGNIGIGTSAPSYKLHVTGGAIALDADEPLRGGGRWLISGNSTQVTVGTSNPDIGLRFDAGLPNRMFINGTTGNVGIGTTTPNQKLTVNGTIYGKEVKVDLSVPGPDYVFEKDYDLPSLEEIKKYIDQHKHLPEVPSGKEMETNGINVSEMNMILLKKVEELTLYLIEQKKEIQELRSEIRKIKK